MATILNPVLILDDGQELEMHMGVIEDTFLGREDHGMFSVNINIGFGATHQGTGHYRLDKPTGIGKGREEIPRSMEFLIALCHVVGVPQWEFMAGKPVYALRVKGRDDGEMVGLANVREPTRFLIFAEFWKHS